MLITLSIVRCQGSRAVLSCEIVFEDLEKLLNLAKMYKKY